MKFEMRTLHPPMLHLLGGSTLRPPHRDTTSLVITSPKAGLSSSRYFPHDPDTDHTITIVDQDLDKNKKLRCVSRSIIKFFGQLASITRKLSLAKSVSIEIALTAQVSFTFFFEYCRCFSECKMASKRNWEEVVFIDFGQH